MREHERLVVFDLETGGLDPERHPIIQFAGIALNHRWEEIDAMEVKIRFNPADCDPQALERNSYNPEIWAREAHPETQAISRITAFFDSHKTMRKVSKHYGNSYLVARLCGHNAANFDGKFLAAWYKRNNKFCPGACFECLDTLQLARWFRLGVADADGPESLELGVVCRRLGIELIGAHDALADVRATAALARRLVGSMDLAGAWA